MLAQITAFNSYGYTVIQDVFSLCQIDFARELVSHITARHRNDDRSVVSASVSVASLTEKLPHRNPGVQSDSCLQEPFIIGDLIALDKRFADLFVTPIIWQCASELLECSLKETVFHLSNITRKPPFIGPGIGWHRDAGNTYFAAENRRTLRLLFPLQQMSKTNGGTAIVPQSHLPGFDSANESESIAVYPLVPSGSCLALHADVLHGGMPNRSQYERDVLVIQFGIRNAALSHRSDEYLSLCGQEEFEEFRKRFCTVSEDLV